MPLNSTSSLSFIIFTILLFPNMSYRNKRNLELTSIYSSDSDSFKKVDTPISDRFIPQITKSQYQLEKNLIEFIEDEILYLKSLSIVITVYKSLLANVPEYENILTSSEQHLLFEDISTFKKISGQFLVGVIRSIGRNRSEQLETEDQLMDLNAPYLVYNCQLKDLNLGYLANHHLFDSMNYKKTIIRYAGKLEFMKELLNNKNKVFPIVGKWLVEGGRLVNTKTHAVTLEMLLSKPLERVGRYPQQLKRLQDSYEKSDTEKQHQLSLSLVKVNKLLHEGYHTPTIRTWAELRDLNVYGSSWNHSKNESLGEFNNNLEYRLPSAYDYKASGTVAAGGNETHSEGSLASIFKIGRKLSVQKKHSTPDEETARLAFQFKSNYRLAKELKKSIQRFAKKVQQFTNSQITYTELWDLVLRGNNYSDGILNKYQQKMNVLKTNTQDHTQRMKTLTDKVEEVIQILKPLEDSSVVDPSKLRAMNNYTSEAIGLVNQNVVDQHLMWLQGFIGEQKLKELKMISTNYPNHEDIIHFYQKTQHSSLETTRPISKH